MTELDQQVATEVLYWLPGPRVSLLHPELDAPEAKLWYYPAEDRFQDGPDAYSTDPDKVKAVGTAVGLSAELMAGLTPEDICALALKKVRAANGLT